MSSISLKTVSTVDAVCKALENDVFSRCFAPGSKITENDLTSRYGVSRNTIREAITFLLSEGLLVKVQNKGVYVKQITGEDVREIFGLRELLEKQAARAIVEAGVIPPVLWKATEELEQLSIHSQWETHIKTDIRFHKELVKAAASPRLSRLYETISSEVKLCIFQSHSIVPPKQENVSQHRLLVEALKAGDLERACRILSNHMESAIRSYESSYLSAEQGL